MSLASRLMLALTVLMAAHASPQAPAAPVFVALETELGTITVSVDVEHAPITAANFLKYVDGKFYDGGVINRAVRPDNTTRHDVEIQVIQFQSDSARRREQFPPIPMERTSVTGLKHVDGALSMARNGPDTATSSFSIVIGDQPEMDFGGKRNPDGQGFAVFGRVVAGMDVVKKIQAAHTGTSGAYGTESLDPPITIIKATRVTAPKDAGVTVVVQTALGSFEMEIDTVHAPATAANFMKYVDAGAYDGGRFHRTVRPETETNKTTPIEVIQASRAMGKPGFPAIALERTNATGLKHVDGAVSMARSGPDSATSDFFVCIGDQPELDFAGRRNADGQGFAVFGRVVRGMDVVRKIQAAPVRAGSQNLDPPISITRISRK